MAKGVTIPLIVDPKGAIAGLGKASDKSETFAARLGTLGKIGGAAIAALGVAALGAATALTAATKSAGAYAENVTLAASKTHLTTDAVQELQYASKITGVEFETIQRSMAKLTKSVGLAGQGNKETAAAFASLGVSTKDANGNLRDSTAIYDDVISALGQVSNPTERDIIAMQLLGKSATDLNPLIDGSAGSIADLAAQAHAAGAVLSGDMLNGLGNVDDAFDKLEAGVGAAKNALGLTLMPVLQELGDQGSGLLGQFTSAVVNANGDLGKAAPEIGAVVSKAADFILQQLPTFLTVGTSIVTSLVGGLVKMAPSLVQKAVPLVLTLVTGILSQLPALVDAGAKVLVALVQGVAAALPKLIPAAVEAVIGIVQALIDNLPLLLDAGLQLLTGLADGLIAALPVLIAALPGIIVGLVTFLIGAIPQLIQTGITLLTSLIGALPTIITAIVDALPQIITGIITAVISATPQLIQAGISLFISLIGALPQIISSLIGAVPQIITGLFNAFTDPKFLNQMGKAGLELIHGLWEGIKGAGDWLWNQVKGFFGGLLNQIKDFLGIHSPSTVFAGFGLNLVQGLEVGLSGPNSLGRIMGDLSRQVTGGFTGSLDVRARDSLTASQGFGGTSTVAQSASPAQINMPVYMLPEQDPRIVGRQLGRELVRTLAGTS